MVGAGQPGELFPRKVIEKFQYFTNHLVATGSEWVMVSSLLLIILSMAAELRFAYAHAPRVVFRRTDHPECKDNPSHLRQTYCRSSPNDFKRGTAK